jgi:putative tricarboxylic transport membrane protein
MIGAYASASELLDVWIMLIAGIAGFVMRRHGFGLAPLVMGLILGNILEERFSQAMIMYDNNFFAFFESPIVVGFFALTFFSLFWPFAGPFIKRAFSRRQPSVESS